MSLALALLGAHFPSRHDDRGRGGQGAAGGRAADPVRIAFIKLSASNVRAGDWVFARVVTTSNAAALTARGCGFMRREV